MKRRPVGTIEQADIGAEHDQGAVCLTGMFDPIGLGG
jgi:hypothetical protein